MGKGPRSNGTNPYISTEIETEGTLEYKGKIYQLLRVLLPLLKYQVAHSGELEFFLRDKKFLFYLDGRFIESHL